MSEASQVAQVVEEVHAVHPAEHFVQTPELLKVPAGQASEQVPSD
jgi:hypothetical protein